MALTVRELRQRLEQIEEEHPDADVVIDPPYSPLYGVYYREEDDTVELSH